MAMNEKDKIRVKALAKKLKEKKGINIKQSGLQSDINRLKKDQEKIIKLKSESESLVIHKEADLAVKKLQSIIDDINDYMTVLHPEGLLDYGSSTSGGKVMGQG
jgi:hypothetical protein